MALPELGKEGVCDGLQRYIGIFLCFALVWFGLHLGVGLGEVDGEMSILEAGTQGA